MNSPSASQGNRPIRGTTRVAGVWGYPVKHSASPAMHNAAFQHLGLDWVYVPFTVAPTEENVARAIDGIRALDIAGVNVTVPLKEMVPPYLDALTERAERLGSVNTILNRDGYLTGDSTDGEGFLRALEHVGFTVAPDTRVVVLGAGGSARAVVDALVQAGAQVIVANRSEERARALVRELGAGLAQVIGWGEGALRNALDGATLLVNTTSMGMSPNPDACPPVPEEALSPSLLVSDLVYNPPMTQLLRRAHERGCRVQNGIEMLVRQGAVAFELWTGQTPSATVMRNAAEQFLHPQTL